MVALLGRMSLALLVVAVLAGYLGPAKLVEWVAPTRLVAVAAVLLRDRQQRVCSRAVAPTVVPVA